MKIWKPIKNWIFKFYYYILRFFNYILNILYILFVKPFKTYSEYKQNKLRFMQEQRFLMEKRKIAITRPYNYDNDFKFIHELINRKVNEYTVNKLNNSIIDKEKTVITTKDIYADLITISSDIFNSLSEDYKFILSLYYKNDDELISFITSRLSTDISIKVLKINEYKISKRTGSSKILSEF